MTLRLGFLFAVAGVAAILLGAWIARVDPCADCLGLCWLDNNGRKSCRSDLYYDSHGSLRTCFPAPDHPSWEPKKETPQ